MAYNRSDKQTNSLIVAVGKILVDPQRVDSMSATLGYKVEPNVELSARLQALIINSPSLPVLDTRSLTSILARSIYFQADKVIYHQHQSGYSAYFQRRSPRWLARYFAYYTCGKQSIKFSRS